MNDNKIMNKAADNIRILAASKRIPSSNLTKLIFK